MNSWLAIVLLSGKEMSRVLSQFAVHTLSQQSILVNVLKVVTKHNILNG